MLVPGYNDGEELQRSLDDLAAYAPQVRSVAAVPVGLTKYRDGLTPIRPFTKEEAQDVIRRMTAVGDAMRERVGSRVFYPADEWFILAEQPIPDAEFYEDYPQLENGVGMLALLREQFNDALDACDEQPRCERVVVASGVAAAPYIRELLAAARAKYPTLNAEVIAIKNDFFGERITVSGLVTGGDLIRQLQDIAMDRLLIPANMLRQQGDCFLDDVTVEQVERALDTTVEIVTETDGEQLLAAVMNKQ